MEKLNMKSLNMAKVNTLLRKGYILAGVIMAANMFVVNEVRASINNEQERKEIKEYQETKEKEEENNKEEKDKKASKTQFAQGFFDRLLFCENTFNLIGGAVFSAFNNYSKWCDYNPGWYCKPVWFGWRSKRFLYGVLQFELNFNLGRGIALSIPCVFRLMQYRKKTKINTASFWVSYFIKVILRGFTSMPLTFHISKFNFSISLSLDSIIWAGVDYISKPSGEKEEVKEGEKNEEDGQKNIEFNKLNEKLNNKPKKNESNTNPNNA